MTDLLLLPEDPDPARTARWESFADYVVDCAMRGVGGCLTPEQMQDLARALAAARGQEIDLPEILRWP